ncbi:hypothetical protein PINS_up003023 [Pythium insidiosum]|nr:hypothetical protein PINS_up003023 [Pythium insidiosum]
MSSREMKEPSSKRIKIESETSRQLKEEGVERAEEQVQVKSNDNDASSLEFGDDELMDKMECDELRFNPNVDYNWSETEEEDDILLKAECDELRESNDEASSDVKETEETARKVECGESEWTNAGSNVDLNDSITFQEVDGAAHGATPSSAGASDHDAVIKAESDELRDGGDDKA